MGLLLDAAVILLALLVSGSLALLSWTLAVNGREAARGELVRVAAARSRLASAEVALRARLAAVDARVRDLNDRMRPKGDR